MSFKYIDSSVAYSSRLLNHKRLRLINTKHKLNESILSSYKYKIFHTKMCCCILYLGFGSYTPSRLSDTSPVKLLGSVPLRALSVTKQSFNSITTLFMVGLLLGMSVTHAIATFIAFHTELMSKSSSILGSTMFFKFPSGSFKLTQSLMCMHSSSSYLIAARWPVIISRSTTPKL